jgi:uncharacterized membrane protein
MILLVILPGAKATLESPSMLGRLMKDVAQRFTPLANISILVLILTGVVIIYYEEEFTGFLGFSDPWSTIMFSKHFLVALMVLIHFYRGLMLNPRIEKLSFQVNESQTESSLSSKVRGLQKFSLNLVKTNLVLGLIVLLLTGVLSSL